MSINKKCPPGVICVENITMFFILVVVFIVIYLIYVSLKPVSVNNNHKIVIQERQEERNYNSGGGGPGFGSSFFGLFTRPNYAYSNLPGDVLMNPYVPPLRDERYLVPELAMAPPGRVPINISTNPGAVDTAYRQMGILTPLNGVFKKILLLLKKIEIIIY